jgi:hypothetical protein
MTKQQLLRSAVATHERLTRDAMTGRGVDRHLFGLQQMPDADTAELFSNGFFHRSQTWRLSTSGLSAGHLFRGTGCVRVVHFCLRDLDCLAAGLVHHCMTAMASIVVHTLCLSCSSLISRFHRSHRPGHHQVWSGVEALVHFDVNLRFCSTHRSCSPRYARAFCHPRPTLASSTSLNSGMSYYQEQYLSAQLDACLLSVVDSLACCPSLLHVLVILPQDISTSCVPVQSDKYVCT